MSVHRMIAFLLLLVCNITGFAQMQLSGHWEGEISIMNLNLGIRVDFTGAGDELKGTIDIPMQNAFSLPLQNIALKLPIVQFDLQAGPGVASFSGELSGDSISGDFSQAGMAGTFRLRRAASSNAAGSVGPAALYSEEEVSVQSGEIRLAGSLSMPKSPGSHPAVILITGSGPQNRDEEIFGFKPFKLIADYLAKAGIAVLRCDDRGVGKSEGSLKEATGAEFADDVESQLKYLKGREGIDRGKIGLIGHSEGGIIAPLVASRSEGVSFLVLMGAPAVPGDKIILKQLETQARAGGATEAEISKALELQQKVYGVVRSGVGWDDLRAALENDAKESLKKLSPEEIKSLPNPDSLIRISTDAKMKGARSPWFRYFIDLDPAAYLEKIGHPVLALYGEKDMQVTVEMNKGPMEAALNKGKNRSSSVEVIPGANHLFQESVTGNPSEYQSLKPQFVEGFLQKISDWIISAAGKR